MGTGLVAAMIAIPLSLITIALGWVVYRPLLGITVLVVAVAAFVFLLRMALARKKKAPAPELPPLPQTPGQG
jgi:hypothetical protein